MFFVAGFKIAAMKMGLFTDSHSKHSSSAWWDICGPIFTLCQLQQVHFVNYICDETKIIYHNKIINNSIYETLQRHRCYIQVYTAMKSKFFYVNFLTYKCKILSLHLNHFVQFNAVLWRRCVIWMGGFFLWCLPPSVQPFKLLLG